jgi:predicted RNA-binding protein with PUA-like domain
MNYWLLKSEPETYGWEDLVRDRRTHWDGVRNPQATKNLQAMKTGDRAFFYHSGEQRAIVGLCEIVKEFHPDPKDKTGRFGMVDVAVLEPLKTPVTLQQIKAEARLADFALVRQGRLSVVPVSATQWKLIAGLGGIKP